MCPWGSSAPASTWWAWTSASLVKRKGKSDARRPHQHYCGGTYMQADSLEVLADLDFLRSFDFIHASPPCQAYSSLRHISKGKVYPDLIPQTRASLTASGVPYSIENVEGAPLSGWLTMLCGTMFGLVTPDGRAEIRRHRLFETSFSIALRPQCQHRGYQGSDAHSRLCTAGGKAMSGGMMTPQGELKRRTISVTGNTPQNNTVRNVVRETFTIEDARAAMGIDWMPMKYLSQAIPPAYAEWVGRQAILLPLAAIFRSKPEAAKPCAVSFLLGCAHAVSRVFVDGGFSPG